MSESTMDKITEAQSGVADEGSATKAMKFVSKTVDAALMFCDELGPIIASGPTLGVSTKLTTKLVSIGFIFFIPLSKDQTANEQKRFGVCHHVDRSIDGGAVVPSDKYRLEVRFPREGCTYTFEEASKPVFDQFPDARGREKGLTVIRISLSEEARVTVGGFGTPFANVEDAQLEGWINGNKPIVNNITLLDVLRQKTFCAVVRLATKEAINKFSVDRLPPPTVYPYGSEQEWDVVRVKGLIKANKGHQFDAAYSHDDDNHHMTAVNQSIVQDVMWLDDAAIEIAATKFPAYFVRSDSGAPMADTDRFFVVVAVRDGFIREHGSAWNHLSKKESLLLHLYDHPESTKPDSKWECKIVHHAASVPALEHHKTKKQELVLLACRPKQLDMNPNYIVREFDSRAEADCALEQGSDRWHHVSLCFDAGLSDCKRKVEAVALFHPLAEPSNPIRWKLPADKRALLTDEQKTTLAHVKDRMELHRALVRGNGFYDWMLKKDAPESIGDAMSTLSVATTTWTNVTYRPLPSVNLLDFGDDVRAQAIVNEALPHDRDRFRGYLSNRPLGLGIIAASPGTGKTTAGAAAAAAMVEKYDRVLCSGPTHVAVGNFAARLDARTRAMVKTCNQGKAQNDPKRYRHRVVIRAYMPIDEVDAFNALLKDPTLGDDAAPEDPIHASEWKLHLSLVFWLLVILGSPAVRELHLDDAAGLWDLRRRINEVPPLKRLRDVATGVISWEQYKQEGLVTDKSIKGYMLRLLLHANMLCTTPAETEIVDEYRAWKNRYARGVEVDEAAAMSRADLYCVWGNTLSPCFLIGDPKQLLPKVLTLDEKDIDGNYLNRFAKYGNISALLFFMATSIPVYRLSTQLRMGNGLFDMVSDIIYKGVPYTYDISCNASNAAFEIGRILESYIREKYPTVAACPENKLLPVFIHTPGSRMFHDPISSARLCPDQVKVALDFAVGLVESTKIGPSKIVFIAPYATNVGYISGFLRYKEAYKALKGMPPPSTVESFQGQESDIVIVVMGTTNSWYGPGFTTQKERLSVMLTRHRCGLVVVGDINVTGSLVDDKGKMKGKGNWKDKDRNKIFVVEGPNGQISRFKAAALRRIHEEFVSAGRVITIPVVKKQAEQAPAQ